tara:strand:- start:100 stop:243 length:144 start_codon:yes stop_codon:yes gene_type:complete
MPAAYNFDCVIDQSRPRPRLGELADPDHSLGIEYRNDLAQMLVASLE